MLTVLIETLDDEEGLARTLASLVEAAVEGVVREVIVCDLGSTDGTRRVADHAGCGFVSSDGIASAIDRSKGDWLLLLESGARLSGGWMDTVAEHVSTASGAARFTRVGNGRGEFLRRLFSSPAPLADGLLIAKSPARKAIVETGDLSSLARRISARRIPVEIRLSKPAASGAAPAKIPAE